MKKSKIILAIVLFISSIHLQSQSIQIRSNGSCQLFKTGLPMLWFGSYSWNGINNGEWSIDTNSQRGTCDDGSLTFGRPWPASNYGNYFLYLAANGNIGIGKQCPSYKLDVEGDIATYGTLRISSDGRLKSNINELKLEAKEIYKLIPKSYNKSLPIYVDQKNRNNQIVPDSIFLRDKTIQKQKTVQAKEFGFIAQELQEVYPNLITIDSSGYYAIDYIGLIPIIIQTLKDQKELIDVQSMEIENIKQLLNENLTQIDKIRKSSELEDTDNLSIPMLEQNIPNPFTNSTFIKFYLPPTIAVADIYIYDMSGIQLKKFNLEERGKSSITIEGSILNAGMYIYSLVADGKIIDTKRMILTK